VATDEFAATRAVFKDNCAKCHGENAAGGRVQVEGREIKVPNLTGEHARKPTDERLVAKITEGDDEMPAFKDKLAPEQIQELVRFIRKEFQGR
jgi:cytochrome c6